MSEPDLAATVERGPRLRAPAIFALAVVLVAFGGFGGWAAVARLDSAAVAPGAVRVESHRKTVQHVDGGIVKRLLVREGDAVKAGGVLLELDDTQPRAALAIVRQQYALGLARQARLQAELAGRPDVAFPPELVKSAADPEVAVILATQRKQFQSRREADKGQVAIFERRIGELQQEIVARTAAVNSAVRQLALIEEEIAGVQTLIDKGLERKPRLLALQRAAADLAGRRSEETANIARARQSIAALQAQIADLANQRRSEVSNDIEATQKDLADLAERRVAALDLLKRMTVLAPQDGVVVALQVFTPGAVIRPGEPIMDIVPREDGLVVDARVSPGDIDTVRPGLPAQVRLLAYKQRRVPPVSARVEDVSADLLVDPRTGESYYSARIRLDAAELRALQGVDLYPGMPVEAFIVTGERTALAYLISPLADGLRRAFREE